MIWKIIIIPVNCSVKAFTYSVYFNYKRKFRSRPGGVKTPIEILNDLNPPNINPNHIGIFPPIITDYHLDAVTKSGYHVPRSDNCLENFS